MHAEKIVSLKHSSATSARILSGVVESGDDSGYLIQGPDGTVAATRAFSCLIEALPGDHVLFSDDPQQGCHILSITRRPDNQDACMLFAADITLQAPNGRLHLNANADMTLSAGSKITQASDDYTVMARQSLFNIDNLTLSGVTLSNHFSRVRYFTQHMEQVVDNLMQQFRNVFRNVSQLDQSRSREVLHEVEDLYALRSSQASITARSDIKIDAERIHMG